MSAILDAWRERLADVAVAAVDWSLVTARRFAWSIAIVAIVLLASGFALGRCSAALAASEPPSLCGRVDSVLAFLAEHGERPAVRESIGDGAFEWIETVNPQTKARSQVLANVPADRACIVGRALEPPDWLFGKAGDTGA